MHHGIYTKQHNTGVTMAMYINQAASGPSVTSIHGIIKWKHTGQTLLLIVNVSLHVFL